MNYNELKSFLILYYALLNICGIFLMGMDKAHARKSKTRIPEKILLFVGLFGGALGLYIGLKKFRHKTKHKLFSWGLPLFIFLHILLHIYWTFY